MIGRPVARAVVALAVLLLGVVAAGRLPTSYLAGARRPALAVWLGLPASAAAGPEDVSRRFVVEIETALRSLGGVRALTGSVHSTGAQLVAHLESAADPEVKTARLLSDLAGFRARLPEGASLAAWPAVSEQADAVALLALSGPDAPEAASGIADALRAVAGVRDVRSYGEPEHRTTLTVRRDDGDGTVAAAVRTAVRAAMAARRLGTHDSGTRRWSVLSGSGSLDDLQGLRVALGDRVVRLDAVAEVTHSLSRPRRLARVSGREAIVFQVLRERSAALLTVDRDLRAAAARVTGASAGRLRLEVVESQADALHELLGRLALGLTAATLVGSWLGAVVAGRQGAWRLALAPALAVAASLNALWLGGLGLDVTTLTALALATACSLGAVALRLCSRERDPELLVSHLTLGVLVPVAVAVAGGALQPALAAPARAFALCLVASALALMLLAGRAGARRRRSRVTAALRRSLRDPATVLLVAGTIAYLCLWLFGSGLDPRSRAVSPQRGRLLVDIALPEGASLGQSEDVTRRAEALLEAVPEVERCLSYVEAGAATLALDVAPEHRDAASLRAVRTRLLYRLAGAGVPVTVREAPGARSARLDEQAESRPAADAEASVLRVILRGPEVGALRDARDMIFDRARRLRIPVTWLRAEWSAPSRRVEVTPRRSLAGDPSPRLASGLAERSVPPTSWTLPGSPRRELVVRARGRPDPGDPPPQREVLLDGLLAGADGFLVASRVAAVGERTVPPSLPRESGRFVLPVTVSFGYMSADKNRKARQDLHRSLGLLPLPAGVDLERPPLSEDAWTAERLRMLGLGALVPVLLLAASAFHLNSLRAGVAAVVPAAMALAVAALGLGTRGVVLDELTLFALVASGCGALPASLTVARRILAQAGGRGSPGLAAYAGTRATAPALAGVAGVSGVALLVPGLGVDISRADWAAPLFIGALTLTASFAAAALLLPAVLAAALTLARHDRVASRRRRRPPEWRSGARPVITVRSLTKVYPSGFRALSDVSFELEPSIVGLLGPNGAGKTTLLRTLTGLLAPTRGEVRFHGVLVEPACRDEYRRHVGFLPQEFNAYPGFTAERFLEYWALEQGMASPRERREEIARLLSEVGLSEDARRKVRDFSGGMRQRIGVARALLGAPPLLVVDEPTTGLDVEARNRFRETLLDVARERIVILSTHVAGDVEATASRLLLLHRGRLRFDGPPARLLERARGRVFETVVPDEDVADFARRFRVTTRVRELGGIRVRGVARPDEPLPGPEVPPSLEEAYLAEIDVAEGRTAGSHVGRRFGFLADWRQADRRR